MNEHENKSTKDLATGQQLWRLNQLGLVELRDEPGEPLGRGPAKEVLSEAARRGLWVPTRGPRGPVRSG
jgi:hypothetical protein